MKIGVCYYPEHWPESNWVNDAKHMKNVGIKIVRIGEFAWSRFEPNQGHYDFDWFSRAIDTLHNAGLQVILGTPTATPPAWLIRNNPHMLAVGEDGHVRDFGSRRHYCFSSEPYKQECSRIVTKMAELYGEHPAVVAWQTDNEYGCHSTTISYSDAAISAFQQWCEQEYKTIDALNDAWGNVFWSMEYQNFTQIGAPVLAVTETNPAHRLAFWRFSSHQVKLFNKLQCEILRRLSPGRDIVHNFMGNFVEFDHFDVAKDLDVASWDNYPLGFLTRDGVNADDQKHFLRTGHPDSSAFHHELYRACGKGRLWLMEQQPGPVNWAPYNPAPLSGMVRLWGWEAFAHGAEVVSYFRWKQVPYAQEQMHTALCLPNGEEDDAAREIKVLAQELEQLRDVSTDMEAATVALVFDYVGDQAARIQQPDGMNYDPLVFTQRVYSALRQLGVMVDIVPTDAKLDHYQLVCIPNACVSNAQLANKLSELDVPIILFPRAGSKTAECSIPAELPPGALQTLMDIKITRVESLPPTTQIQTNCNTVLIDWRERVEAGFSAHEQCPDGWGFHYQQGKVHYYNACPTQADLIRLLSARLSDASIQHRDLGKGLRIQRCGDLTLAFNYGPEQITLTNDLLSNFGYKSSNGFVFGTNKLNPAELCAWI